MSEESGAPPVTGTFLALILIGFFARLSYGMARTPLLALFARSLGATPTILGLVVGMSTVTGIFFKAPAGTLSDVYGRRAALFSSVLIFGLMPFAYYFIHDIRLLVAIRFFHGFATAIYGPVAMAVIMDIAGEKKGQLIGTYSSASILGGMIAAPLGGGLLQWLGGDNPAPSVFRQIYLVVGLIGSVSLLLVLVLWRRLPSRASPDPPSVAEVMRKFREDVVAVLTDSQVLLTSGMEGVQNLTVGALEAFLPVYVTVTAGLTSFHAGVLWGVQLVVLFLARPVMGRVSDAYGRKPLITAGMLICMASFIFYPTTTDFTLLVALTLVFGLGEAMVTSSTAAMVAEQTRARGHGTSMGVFGSLWDIGHASGPILTGFLLSRYDYLPSFGVISVILLMATVLFQYYVREPKRVP
ncbi:MFS transporter [Candidatus Bathyarchaeota archaeon]|nr:MFS transporter [Candidatus Bathyarchaeota archaeon]MBL7080839.1 MFS transporter [Candidatus Bathyarchaeota archaeon]